MERRAPNAKVDLCPGIIKIEGRERERERERGGGGE